MLKAIRRWRSTAEISIPAYPIVFIYVLFCFIYSVNGIIKIPYLDEYVLDQGVYWHARNWNEMTPYVESCRWEVMRDLPGWCWNVMGWITIFFESTALILLWRPSWFLIWWTFLASIHIGIYLSTSGSFVAFPVLFLACGLPVWLRDRRHG